jgi:glycosyltransferase involved in cell wall biosynthesis
MRYGATRVTAAESPDRRVLMLAYFFPPLGGAGVQRSVKFAKYLPEMGWSPTVITTRSTVYPVKDPTLAEDLPPGLRVLRAREPRGAMGPATVFKWAGLERLSQIASFPDFATAWAPDALRLALKTVQAERPSVLFSTSAPYTAHLVALAVHDRTGVPWVADFRDEWSADPSMSEGPPVMRRVARRLEREITSRATAITVIDRYFDLSNPSASPVVAIPNGVDSDDVRHSETTGTSDAFTLSYVGSIYGDHSPRPVLDVLAGLGARGLVDLDRVRVRLVGNDWRRPDDREWPVRVEQTGYVDHDQALLEMRSASVLLHYRAPASSAPAGKVYEYLASERPVLCVAREDGVAARLVREAQAGPVAAPNDPQAIEDALLSLYERWRDGGLRDQPWARDWVLANYSRRKLAGDLADLFEQVAGVTRPLPN